MTLYSNANFLESRDFPFHAEPYPVGGGEIIEPHAHEFVEMVYIAEGEGEHEYQGGRYRIGQGDVFIIEPEAVHAYRVPEGKRLLVYNILFDPSVFTAELQALSTVTSFVDFFYVEPFLRASLSFQAKLTLTPHEQLELRETLNRMIREYERKESGYRFLIKTKLIETFIVLSRCYERGRSKPMTSMAGTREIMERIAEFIRLHHARPLTLEQVSQLCGMSQSTFTAKFKEATGRTFLEFRNDARIEAACRLLEETDDKIISIAHDTGFEDISNFNRSFKTARGMAPGKYRREKRL